MADGHDDVTHDEWVSIGEAARRLGVTRAAIYGRIERHTLQTRPKGNRGVEVLLPVGAGHGDVAHDGHGNVIMTLRIELARLEERLAASERIERELREALARSEAGRDAAVAQVRAEGEARAAKAEAEAAAQRELVTELKAVVAETRRPWWRRWVG
jgi:hypothetical protein